jgi:hypothetical protein
MKNLKTKSIFPCTIKPRTDWIVGAGNADHHIAMKFAEENSEM